MSSNSELIFVYNAESGLWNWAVDYARKAIAPDSYQCNLCKIIAGNGLSIKKPWREFIESLDVASKFMYLDEFKTLYPSIETLAPAVFWVKSATAPEQILTNQAINQVKDLDDLIQLVKTKLTEKQMIESVK